MRPKAAYAMVVVERTRVRQVTPESPGIPRAMVYGLYRALPGDRLSNAHIFFWLRSLVETDSLVGIGLAEGGFMSMEVALGRFGDRRLEKGGRRCMRPSFDVQAPAFDALQGTGPKRFGSRVFCAMKG